MYYWSSLKRGKVEVFRRNHLIRLAESTKTKPSIVTFRKNDIFLLIYLSNQIWCSKNILLNRLKAPLVYYNNIGLIAQSGVSNRISNDRSRGFKSRFSVRLLA